MNNRLPLPMMVFSIMIGSLSVTACGESSSESPSSNANNNSSMSDETPAYNTSEKLACKASNASYKTSLYDDTYVVKASAAGSSKLDQKDIIATCSFGTVCYQDTYTENGHKPRNGGQAFCARSVLDKNSPYYDFGADLGFTEFMRYPTKLEIDCRSRVKSVTGSLKNAGQGSSPADPNNKSVNPKGGIMNCAQPTRIDRVKWPVPYGNGPVFNDFNSGGSTWLGAEFNPKTREIFALIQWSNSQHDHTTTIVAWNVDTKDRRIVSGIYPDSQSGDKIFGSGYESPIKFHNIAKSGKQPMTWVDTIRLANDGYLYVASEHEIIKVDQNTGKRELVWQKQNQAQTGDITNKYGQCFRPGQTAKDGLQLEKYSFAVGQDGKFYRGFRDVKGGNGVLQLSKDAKNCQVITRWNARNADNVGTGFLPSNINSQVRGMLVHDGKLYMSIAKALVSLDLASGTRKRVDDGYFPHSPGYTSMYYDPNRKVIWTSGSSGAVFGNVVVDPITGQKEQIVTDSGRQKYGDKAIFKSVYPGGGSAANTGGGAVANQHSTQLGGVIIDPKDADIAYGIDANGGLLKFELSTFNNYVHSWGQH